MIDRDRGISSASTGAGRAAAFSIVTIRMGVWGYRPSPFCVHFRVRREGREIELGKIGFHSRIHIGAGIRLPGVFLVSSENSEDRPNSEMIGARSGR